MLLWLMDSAPHGFEADPRGSNWTHLDSLRTPPGCNQGGSTKSAADSDVGPTCIVDFQSLILEDSIPPKWKSATEYIVCLGLIS